MVTYLEFLQNEQLQRGLQSIVSSPMALFSKDITSPSMQGKPLFLKYISQTEKNNTLDFTKMKKINPPEEDRLDYEIRTLIANWLANTYNLPFATSAFPAVYWERTIPKKFNPRFEVTVFPQGQKYNLITFGVSDIIDHLKDFDSDDEREEELDRLHKEKKVDVGRFMNARRTELASGDVVFFCCQTYITLPCTTRAMFVYTRKMLYGLMDPSSD